MWLIFIVICYALLAAAKLVIQSKYLKNNNSNLTRISAFFMFIFLIISLIFLPLGLSLESFNINILWFAIIFGVSTFIYQIFYSLALKEGEVSITSFVVSLSVIFNIIFSLIAFKEDVNIFKIVGFILFLVSLILSFPFKKKKKISIRWIIYITISSIGLISCNIVAKYFSNFELSSNSTYTFTFLAISYGISFLLAFLLFLFTKLNKNKVDIKITKIEVISSIIVGLVLALCVYLNQYMVTLDDYSLVLPVKGAISMIISLISGLIFFKEKLTIKEIILIIIATTAIVLINL